jgi:hypothetical protein
MQKKSFMDRRLVMRMSTILRVVLPALAAAAALNLPPSVRAQQAPSTPKAAEVKRPGPAKVVLRRWNGVGKKLITMSEDFPEDKYDYRPNDQVRTFAQQLLHVAGVNYYVINPAMGHKDVAVDEDPSRDKYKTKADVVAYVKKSVADGAEAIEKSGDAAVVDNLGAWVGIIEHMGEHYGQLVVYYRNNGIVPPDSRRPSQ